MIDFTIEKITKLPEPKIDEIIEKETVYNVNERALSPNNYEYHMDRTICEFRNMNSFEEKLKLIRDFKHMEN